MPQGPHTQEHETPPPAAHGTSAADALPPDTDAAGATPEATYLRRRDDFTAARDRERAHRQQIGSGLQLMVLAAIALILFGVFGGALAPLILGVALVVGAAATLVRLGRVMRVESRFDTLRAVNEEGLHRLRRDWATLPLRQPAVTTPAAPGDRPADPYVDHPYAADLDILGHASLLHLLGTANTPGGQAVLRDWLLQPAAADVILQRQEAVAELASMLDLRDEIAVQGKRIGEQQPSPEPFLRWAESANWLTPRTGLVWLTRVLPLVTIGLLAAELAGLTPYPLWLASAALSWMVTTTAGGEVERLLNQVADRQNVFQPYADLFTAVSAPTFSAPLLREIQAGLTDDGLEAGAQMSQLARVMRYADLRLSFLFPFLQFGLLWNFHVLWFLERWQRTAGPHARVWLTTLTQLEALAALATLAHDHPDWAFPELADDAPDVEDTPVLAARNLGHPLLPAEVCVGNDVTVGPPGAFLMVTGSNMSGKSTLLRAIGVNVVLAQAGGPVCAASLRLRPIALATSMRVQDSLEHGLSYFMAELKRLKLVVDEAGRASEAGERAPLFLLDEILHGTNTNERRIAATYVIQYLLSLHATGVVSTHDLTLARIPELAQHSTLVHFTESFTRGPEGLSMHFDYRLRSGIATSTNALKLMEMAGLPLPKAQGPSLPE